MGYRADPYVNEGGSYSLSRYLAEPLVKFPTYISRRLKRIFRYFLFTISRMVMPKQQGINTMANHGYMTINGKKQGLISAGCSTLDSIGNKCQEGHRDEIMVLSFQHQMANRGNVNASTHGPVVITKHIDKSSPLLAAALSSREELNCVIDFYRTSNASGYEKYYTVDIRGCIIADLTLDVPHAVLQIDAQAQEHLALRYRQIIWTHHLAGTSGYGYGELEER